MRLSKHGFGFAEIKAEGEKLWPQNYLLMNGEFPPKAFYTEEELNQQYEQGYTDLDYAD